MNITFNSPVYLVLLLFRFHLRTAFPCWSLSLRCHRRCSYSNSCCLSLLISPPLSMSLPFYLSTCLLSTCRCPCTCHCSDPQSAFCFPSNIVFIFSNLFSFAIGSCLSIIITPIVFLISYLFPCNGYSCCCFRCCCCCSCCRCYWCCLSCSSSFSPSMPLFSSSFISNVCFYQAAMYKLWFGRNTSEAVTDPRFHHQLLPDYTAIEKPPYNLTSEIIDKLRQYGHNVEEKLFNCVVQAISMEKNGKIYAKSDPRKGGYPAGF